MQPLTLAQVNIRTKPYCLRKTDEPSTKTSKM